MATWGRPTRLRNAPVRRQDVNIQRQYLWNNPDGNLADFSDTFTHGEDILISWNALNNSMYDLWLTSWNYDPDPVTLRLARAVNLAHDGNLKLVTPDPPSAQLANKTQYVLRFKPPTGEQGQFIASDPDLSSPAFYVVKASASQQAAPSTTTSPTATATSVTGRVPAAPSIDAATSSAAPDEESGATMSPLTAAGLTVGLILAVVCLVALEVAYLTWRRKKRRRSGRGGEKEGGGGLRYEPRRDDSGKEERKLFVPVLEKVEMSSDEAPYMSPELPGDSTWGRARLPELHGGGLGLERWAEGIRIVGDHDRPRTPRGAMTLNSSLVELDAGRG